MIVGHAYIVPHPFAMSRYAVVLVDKVNRVMAEGRFLNSRGEWGDPRRFKRYSSSARPLGKLSPRVRLDLLYAAVAKIDENYRDAVRRAEDARQADLNHLSRGFLK